MQSPYLQLAALRQSPGPSPQLEHLNNNSLVSAIPVSSYQVRLRKFTWGTILMLSFFFAADSSQLRHLRAVNRDPVEGGQQDEVR